MHPFGLIILVELTDTTRIQKLRWSVYYCFLVLLPPGSADSLGSQLHPFLSEGKPIIMNVIKHASNAIKKV